MLGQREHQCDEAKKKSPQCSGESAPIWRPHSSVRPSVNRLLLKQDSALITQLWCRSLFIGPHSTSFESDSTSKLLLTQTSCKQGQQRKIYFSYNTLNINFPANNFGGLASSLVNDLNKIFIWWWWMPFGVTILMYNKIKSNSSHSANIHKQNVKIHTSK